MASEEAADAVATYIASLAKQVIADGTVDQLAAHVARQRACPDLPGPDSGAKRALERELRALTARVHALEAKAAAASHHATSAVTPSEGDLPSPFGTASESMLSVPPSPQAVPLSAHEQDLRNWVQAWVAGRQKGTGSDAGSAGHSLNNGEGPTDEQLGVLRDYLSEQTNQLDAQRLQIDGLVGQVREQQRQQATALGTSIEDLGSLKRELAKHQQANEAFQKALREIGSIVTAVANGDLSKKVLIHTKEMDPEITTFKRTINKMVDQLQDFASQVTHLAKEVGTEGRLGGQAVLPGVAGKQPSRDSREAMSRNLQETVIEIKLLLTCN